MASGSSFKPAFWLRNPHAQTIFASKLRPSPPLTVAPERLELDDGDFLDLSWLPEQGQHSDAPVVIVLHGLNGGLESKYARGLLRQVAACCCIFAVRTNRIACRAAIIPAKPVTWPV